jgi:hypothetical protein
MWPRAAVRQAAALGGKSSDERRSMRFTTPSLISVVCSSAVRARHVFHASPVWRRRRSAGGRARARRQTPW